MYKFENTFLVSSPSFQISNREIERKREGAKERERESGNGGFRSAATSMRRRSQARLATSCVDPTCRASRGRSVDREGPSRSGAFRGWVAGAKYGNRDGGGRCRRDTRSRLLKLSGFLGEQRQLRRLGETGPYKDNEVRGTYDSTRLVSSAAFQQGPVTFYVRTYVRGVPRLAPTFYAETRRCQ